MTRVINYCATPQCRRLTLHTHCSRHAAPQGEAVPQHQPHTDRSACVDLTSRTAIPQTIERQP